MEMADASGSGAVLSKATADSVEPAVALSLGQNKRTNDPHTDTADISTSPTPESFLGQITLEWEAETEAEKKARVEAGRKEKEVRICIGSQLMGCSSSESDTDDEYQTYFARALGLLPGENTEEYSAVLARHTARKQVRRDGYSEKEKERRIREKKRIRDETEELHRLMDTAVEFPEGMTLESFFGLDKWPELFKDKLEAGPGSAGASADKPFRNRPLLSEEEMFGKNAWDNVVWGDEQKQAAVLKVENNSKVLVDEAKKLSLEKEASVCWDKFYDIHQNKFFKDRRWLFTEFPELLGPFGCGVAPAVSEAGVRERRLNESFPGQNSKFRILEVGCGNGSTVFPVLLDSNHPDTYVYCCDFSTSAVEIVAASPKLDPSRCTPFVWDITDQDADLPFPAESIDVLTLIFVFSAISPEKFSNALQNINKVLKPGGKVLFRDYGLHDLVQLRQPEGRCISENFYFRGDGTRVYFFTDDEVETLFSSVGLKKESLFVDRRLQINRLKEIKMYRIWIQGKFTKPKAQSPTSE